MTDPTRPASILRLDGLAVALVSIVLYRELGQSWWLFAALFLMPDVAILAYLLNTRVGAATYNVMHTYLWPAVLFSTGFLWEQASVMGIALIWLAHIGVDRVLGFGLKYAAAPFKETHLQRA